MFERPIGNAVTVTDGVRTLEIFLEPGQCRAFHSVFDKAGVAFCKPCLAINVAPKGNALHIFCFYQQGNMLLVAFLLEIVIVGSDIVLGDVYREACLLVGFMKNAFESRRTEALITRAL